MAHATITNITVILITIIIITRTITRKIIDQTSVAALKPIRQPLSPLAPNMPAHSFRIAIIIIIIAIFIIIISVIIIIIIVIVVIITIIVIIIIAIVQIQIQSRDHLVVEQCSISQHEGTSPTFTASPLRLCRNVTLVTMVSLLQYKLVNMPQLVI